MDVEKLADTDQKWRNAGMKGQMQHSALPTFSRILYYNADFPLVPSFTPVLGERKKEDKVIKRKKLKEALYWM